MHKKVKWEIEEKSHEFLRGLYFFIKDYEGQLPNLQEIFRPQAIDWLLTESVNDLADNVIEPTPLIDFIINTGYKDEPIIDEDGKPLLYRSTPVHYVGRYWFADADEAIVIPGLFKIYDRFDVNYTDDNGVTHFHIACEYGCDDVVEKFLELGQDPNVRALRTVKSQEGEEEEEKELISPPLHMALVWNHRKVVKLLLKNGADPNLASECTDGSTPLHAICQRNDDDDLAKLFLEMNDEKNQLVPIDAVDKLGRTPLQWAVTSFLPDVVDLLLDRGADLSSFAFPTKSHFDQKFEEWLYDKKDLPTFKLILVSGILPVIERLEKRGYEMKRSDVLTLMGLFAEHGFFEKSADYDEFWYDDEEFVRISKEIMIIPSLSLYDLIRLRPVEAIKQLKFKDYFAFARSEKLFELPEKGSIQTCVMYLCENLSRGFFRRWALDSFLELTHYRLPILCCDMIIKQLINEDLWHICQAAAGQTS